MSLHLPHLRQCHLRRLACNEIPGLRLQSFLNRVPFDIPDRRVKLRIIIDKHFPATLAPGRRKSTSFADVAVQRVDAMASEFSRGVRFEMAGNDFGIARVTLQDQV